MDGSRPFSPPTSVPAPCTENSSCWIRYTPELTARLSTAALDFGRPQFQIWSLIWSVNLESWADQEARPRRTLRFDAQGAGIANCRSGRVEGRERIVASAFGPGARGRKLPRARSPSQFRVPFASELASGNPRFWAQASPNHSETIGQPKTGGSRDPGDQSIKSCAFSLWHKPSACRCAAGRRLD